MNKPEFKRLMQIGIIVRNVDEAVANYEKIGIGPWVRGQGIHGLMDFSYLDLREELGLIVECYKSLQPGKPAIPYDMKGDVIE